MLTLAIATVALGFAGPQPPLHCPSTLEEITGTPAVTLEYAGSLFGTCCGGCDAPFLKDPAGLIAKAVKANKTVGAFEFDPVSRMKIDSSKAAAFSDYRSIRYYFADASEKKSFDASPAKFVGEVKSEARFCPVMSDAVDPKNAAGFGDYKGVRYFLCCDYCVRKFREDPAKYAANAAAAIKPLSAIVFKK